MQPRVLSLVAAAASAGCLLAASPLSAQEKLSKSEAVRAIVKLPPAAFPELPRPVRRALVARGCVIPQAWEPRPHNVVRGSFTGAARNDWAVLCSPEGQDWVYILVFHDGLASRVDSLALRRLSDYLAFERNRLISVRLLTRATPAEIREMASPAADSVPRCLDHDALHDSNGDDNATIRYRLFGRWRDLGIGGWTEGDPHRADIAKPCGPRSR